MWPDRVSIQGPLSYESGALPTALRGPALGTNVFFICIDFNSCLLEEVKYCRVTDGLARMTCY